MIARRICHWLLFLPAVAVAEGHYATVEGLKVYYEIHGTASATPPLLLLHGGTETIDTSFSKVLPGFAATRLVIAIEQQGHGHTADIDRPLSYERMADDTAAVLKHAGIERVDCFGWSDGGKVGLMFAMRHPDRLRKLAVSGVNFRQDGLTSEAIQWLEDTTPVNWSPDTQQVYERIAPDPRHWDAFVIKWRQFYLETPDWTPKQLRSVRAPTLVMIGDREGVRLEHAQELRQLIAHSRLAVLPGTGHATLLRRPEWVLAILNDYFDAPMPNGR
jgi:pimeloyl-ACP methyl ester carboxylesterase